MDEKEGLKLQMDLLAALFSLDVKLSVKSSLVSRIYLFINGNRCFQNPMDHK